VLHQAAACFIGCAEPMAAGESADGQAFVLLRKVVGAYDLRTYLEQTSVDRRALAASLGKALAKIHDAGFDHPDLYSKHVLVREEDGSFALTFLDWQRGRRTSVDEETRWRNLAALDATLPEDVVSPRERLRLLRAYLGGARSLHGAVERIKVHSAALRKKRRIRELLQRTPADQSIYWLDGEAFCVTGYALQTRKQTVLDLQQEIHEPQKRAATPADTTLITRTTPAAVQAFFGRSFRSPEVNQAGLLFRLQKYRIPAPRLLAFGQKRVAFGRWASFLFVENVPRCRPLNAYFQLAPSEQVVNLRCSSPSPQPSPTRGEGVARAMARQIGEVLRRLHDAGCSVGRVDNLQVQADDDGAFRVVVARLDGMRGGRQFSSRTAHADVRKICRFLATVCGWREEQCFVESYFGAAGLPRTFKNWLERNRHTSRNAA
jgi:tRNA A-37 threonylcarbamoyl transferase component Bud32